MRTTVNIPDEALDLGRRQAEKEGRSLGEVIGQAIVETYRERPAGAKRVRYDFPTFGTGGLRPGVDLDDSSALQELMDGRE